MTGGITLNGDAVALVPTVAAAVAALGLAPDGKGIAVALNGSVVPRGLWDRQALVPGDVVEVIRAVQGG